VTFRELVRMMVDADLDREKDAVERREPIVA
jgi:hypothetical protein